MMSAQMTPPTHLKPLTRKSKERKNFVFHHQHDGDHHTDIIDFFPLLYTVRFFFGVYMCTHQYESHFIRSLEVSFARWITTNSLDIFHLINISFDSPEFVSMMKSLIELVAYQLPSYWRFRRIRFLVLGISDNNFYCYYSSSFVFCTLLVILSVLRDSLFVNLLYLLIFSTVSNTRI